MARINTDQLVDNVKVVGYRAFKVQQDPAVQKAGNQVIADASALGKSAVDFAGEISASWRRHGASGSTAFSGRLA